MTTTNTKAAAKDVKPAGLFATMATPIVVHPTRTVTSSRAHATHRRALMAKDAALARHMDRIGPYLLKRDEISSLYESLAESIVYQQLHGKAAASIFARLRALGADGFPKPAELLAFDEATLRGVGLSGAKARAIRDLATKQHEGALPTIEEAHALDDDTLIERLTSVRGIGQWTVEMLLIFRLGRRDILPATDYGIRQGFQRVFKTKELPTPKQILLRGERWRPHRTMAAWYLWRALDAPKRTPTTKAKKQ